MKHITKSLCLVTYTRSTECITNDLIHIINLLHQIIDDFECYIYSENQDNQNINKKILTENCSSDIKVNFFHEIKGSKYLKILDVLQKTQETYIISIDNDIKANQEYFKKFIFEISHKGFDLAWGKIYAQNVKGFTSNLIFIDKLLSHNIIRPFLWKKKIGISIPGQCFILKKEVFKDRLNINDTFLDDLAIGICAVKYKLSYYISNEIIAVEHPNTSIKNLFKQRKRWANGFYQILRSEHMNSFSLYLLYVHMFFYHILPIIYFLLLSYLLVTWPLLSIIMILFFSLLLVNKQFDYIFWSIVYQIFFPFCHFVWFLEIFSLFLNSKKSSK